MNPAKFEWPAGFNCCAATPIPTVAINQGHEEPFKKKGRMMTRSSNQKQFQT